MLLGNKMFNSTVKMPRNGKYKAREGKYARSNM